VRRTPADGGSGAVEFNSAPPLIVGVAAGLVAAPIPASVAGMLVPAAAGTTCEIGRWCTALRRVMLDCPWIGGVLLGVGVGVGVVVGGDATGVVATGATTAEPLEGV
jgi:hypothetical protein